MPACRLFEQARSGHRDTAKQHYTEARRLAELLRQDRVSTQNSSSHANAENALIASLAAGALERLSALLKAK